MGSMGDPDSGLGEKEFKGTRLISWLKRYFITTSDSARQVAQWLIDNGVLEGTVQSTFSTKSMYKLTDHAWKLSESYYKGTNFSREFNYLEIVNQMADIKDGLRIPRLFILSTPALGTRFTGKQATTWLANHLLLPRHMAVAIGQELILRDLIQGHNPMFVDDHTKYKFSTQVEAGKFKKRAKLKKTVSSPNLQITSVEEVMKNKKTFDMFHKFLTSQFSEENLDFLANCKEWTESFPSASDSDRRDGAQKIVTQYVGESAKTPVNLDGLQAKKLSQLVNDQSQELPGDLFAEAQGKIAELLTLDSIPKFNKAQSAAAARDRSKST